MLKFSVRNYFNGQKRKQNYLSIIKFYIYDLLFTLLFIICEN